MTVAVSLDPGVVTALRDARRVAVLTGAGISAESGIPTFRDALTGLWATFRAEDLATPEAFVRQPAVVWDWYASRRQSIRQAEPNPGHYALVEIARRVPRFTLITQNVDGLHQRAGSTDVIELHGNILRSRCSREGMVVEEPLPPGSPPPCPRCGAPLRPDVVWYGEILPLDGLAAAEEAAATCDVLVSAGTSNLVVPAANIPWIAAAQGATVIVVNTTADGQRRGPGIHCVLGRAGTVLPALVTAAWGDR